MRQVEGRHAKQIHRTLSCSYPTRHWCNCRLEVSAWK